MRVLFPILISLCVSLCCTWTRADTIFVLDDEEHAALADGLNNGDVLTVDGVSLTFSNVIVASGGTQGDVEDWGILLSGTEDTDVDDVLRFDFSFDHDVQILTYDIGNREDIPAESFFYVSGSNGESGDNIILPGTHLGETTHAFDAGTIPIFLAGQSYSFEHSLDSEVDSLFNLEEIVVSAVPEPNSGLLLIGTALIGLCRRTRRHMA